MNLEKLFAVVQEPKSRFRQSHVVLVKIVTAKNQVEAKRKANLDGEAGYFKNPYAIDLKARAESIAESDSMLIRI
jgi:hypothetical protein